MKIMTVLIISFIAGLSIVGIYAIGFTKGFNYDSKNQALVNNLNYSNNCSDLDIFLSSACLNMELKKFYNYNLLNVNKNLSFDELKKFGGVCSHYSEWYKQQMINLGFYAERFKISVDNKTAHSFTIASSKDGYCVLDGKDFDVNTNCWWFDIQNEKI